MEMVLEVTLIHKSEYSLVQVEGHQPHNSLTNLIKYKYQHLCHWILLSADPRKQEDVEF